MLNFKSIRHSKKAIKKVAICISGHVSSSRMANLVQLINSFKLGFREFEYVDSFAALSISSKTDLSIANDFINGIQARSFSIEEESPLLIPQSFYERCEGNVANTVNMFLKFKKAHELKCAYSKAKCFEYDYVVRARPDMVFVEQVKVPWLLQVGVCDLAIPKFPWSKVKRFRQAKTDWFAIGKNFPMAIYADIVNHLGSLVQNGVLFHPETLLGSYLKRENLRTLCMRTPCYFDPSYRKLNGFRPEKNIQGTSILPW